MGRTQQRHVNFRDVSRKPLCHSSLAESPEARPKAATQRGTCAVSLSCRVGHQVHRPLRGEVRQPIQAQPHDDLGDGLLDLVFEPANGLWVRISHQSDFFVLSVFN